MTAPLTANSATPLLEFLFASLPEVKRTKVRQWLKYGAIQVNGVAVTQGNHALHIGDCVTVLSKGQTQPASRLPAGMTIVFEDATLIVIDKPENLLSIASETERDKTAHAYLSDYVKKGNKHSKERVWIVHRLDRETSGLMVFAKTEAAKQALQNNWNTAQKQYLAVVEGGPIAEHGTIESHLDESGPYKVFSTTASERTRLAITHYRVLKRTKTNALIELDLETGRRNQIRVHLADERCPIIGDPKYGAVTNPARRLGLHASQLQIVHPTTNDRLTFSSPLPDVLARLFQNS